MEKSDKHSGYRRKCLFLSLKTIYSNGMKNQFSILFFVAAAFTGMQAQVQLIPLGDCNPALVREHSLRNNLFCSDTGYVSLPFFDDFANNSNGYYPNCSRWQNNHAFVNNDMAYNPPSIGVATLDGLDPMGYPYNKQISPAVGYPADTLTSQLLDLSSFNDQSGLVLSFFYQPQGLSDRPESTDSLLLEFRDSSNQWQKVFITEGVDGTVSANELIDFMQQFIPVSNTVYLHDSFQFRFRNLASITGANDHWHLDYIYLAANRNIVTPTYYEDVAFTHTPVSPLREYSAMPWRHVSAAVWNDTLDVRTFNHSNISGTMDREYTVYDLDPTNLSPELLYAPIAAVTYSPSPNADDELTGGFLGSFQTPVLDSATVLESTYTLLNPTDFQNNPIFAQNDTARRYTVLSNYFAYDDGTAETRIIAQGVGTKIAVEFKAEVADTIRGIYFHMPHFTNRDAELDYINVKVWVDSLSDSSEVYTRDIYRLRYVEGHNGWHFMELVDFADAKQHIGLAPGQTFYIGWQQSSITPVPVGYDRSNDASDKTYVSAGGAPWELIDLPLKGAIMIRPLLSMDSTFQVIPVVRTEPLAAAKLRLYPNPTSDQLHLAIEGDFATDQAIISIYNTLGQLVLQQNFSPSLSINTLPSGWYALVVENGRERLVERVVKE